MLHKNPVQDRRKDINTRLSEIRNDFIAKLAVAGSGIWITEDELDGLPIDTIKELKEDVEPKQGRIFLKV
jgi:Zn-dependent oligopeptidase